MKKKPELRQLRQLRITEAIFLKKNLNYVNYVITPITQLQKRQNHPFVLPLVIIVNHRQSVSDWINILYHCQPLDQFNCIWPGTRGGNYRKPIVIGHLYPTQQHFE